MHPFHPIADEYPLMPALELGRMEQDMRQRGFDQRFPIVLFEGKILDGRNRETAAERAGVKPTYVQFQGTDEEAKLFAQRANEERRHLAREWLEKRRQERIERVAKRRSEGASLRTIAAEEGVSPPQVLADVRAGVSPLTPENEKVIGRDGKTYSASKPRKKPEQESPPEQPQEFPPDDVQRHPDDEPPKKQAKKPGRQLVDGQGNPVPERLRDVFADEFLRTTIQTLRQWNEGMVTTPILSGVRARFAHLPWLRLQDFVEQVQEADTNIALAIETASQALPYAVCSACVGEGCERCRHSGYLSQWRWEELQGEAE